MDTNVEQHVAPLGERSGGTGFTSEMDLGRMTNFRNWTATPNAVMVRDARPIPLVRNVEQAKTSVYTLDPLSDPRWSEFVARRDQASVFHSVPWLRALQKTYGYEPIVVTTTPPRVALRNGLLFCRIQSWLTGSRLVSLPFSDHCEPLVNSTKELDELLAAAQQDVDARRCKYAEIRPILVEPGSGPFGTHLTYCFHRLDLRGPIDEIFRRFHKDCVQRKIRRAEKEKLVYEEGNSPELLRAFYRLLTGMRRRKALPPQPITWFERLAEEFGNDLKIRVASHNGLPVASILTLSHKKVMTYKYGCSDTSYNKLGGMALLFWKTIQEAKEQAFDELDFGRSDSDNLGLIAFKDHWGATSSSLTYWKYPRTQASSSWMNNRVMRRAASAAPDILLRVAGKLLYKHIG
jgi:hypothetical protein